LARGHIRKRIYKSGITWQIIIELGLDENGDRQRMYKSTYTTKKEAEKELQKLLTDLDGGTYIEDSKITVATNLRNWLKTYVEPTLAATTIDGYKSNIENYIIPNIGSIPLQKLTPVQVQEMYQKLSKDGRLDGKGGLAPRTIRSIHRIMSKAFNEALKMQIIKRNVTTMVSIPKAVPYKAKIYEEEEIITLLNNANGSDMSVPITLAVALGLRRGEILGLKWADIDLAKSTLTVNNNLVSTNAGAVLTTPKTKTSHRALQMSKGIVILLKRHLLAQRESKLKLGTSYQDNDFVCCYPDGSIYQPKNFSKKFAWFLKKHNMPHVRFHDLRHSNATIMLKYGVPAKIASERLGHTSISVTMDLYSHVTASMQTEVAQKIEDGIFSKLAASNS